MEVNLDRTTFDKIEIGSHFYTVTGDQLNHFVKLPFEKAMNIDDDSINHFQRWSGVLTLPQDF